ncbi:hypothetical protein LLG10_08335 [bacterium]|nr:hypothetical protein [bacterium]
MMVQNRKRKGLQPGFYVGALLLLIVILGFYIYYRNPQSTMTQEKSSDKITITDNGKVNIPKNPADNSPPAGSVTNQPEEDIVSNPLAAPNVDSLIKEPLAGDRLKQYRQLQTSLYVQQEIYNFMIKDRDKETDPDIKAKLEKDIEIIEQKIISIQKEIDSFH